VRKKQIREKNYYNLILNWPMLVIRLINKSMMYKSNRGKNDVRIEEKQT